MTEREKYFWDLTGYLIVRGVLSVEEIAEANEALDYAKKDIFQHEEGRGDYTALKGTAARWYARVAHVAGALLRTFSQYARASSSCRASQ